MSQEILDNDDSGLEARSKINNNFSELYQADVEASAALLAALANLIVAGPGITATFNPSTVQWTISVSASGSIGTAIIGSTFIVG